MYTKILYSLSCAAPQEGTLNLGNHPFLTDCPRCGAGTPTPGAKPKWPSQLGARPGGELQGEPYGL